jgi:formylmethanofuran dehydrogenase subunit E
MTARYEDALALDIIRAACARSVQDHDRLCPRQVLGVRMGLALTRGLRVSNLEGGKRLLVIPETDGCFVDGVQAATGCSVGHRTLRLADYGRVAVTGIDGETGEALRVSPRPGVRERAADYAPGEHRRYYQQMDAYQAMPEHELLRLERVALTFDLAALLGRRGVRVDCARCGEEVLNGREVTVDGHTLCPACAGTAYYRCVGAPALDAVLPSLGASTFEVDR